MASLLQLLYICSAFCCLSRKACRCAVSSSSTVIAFRPDLHVWIEGGSQRLAKRNMLNGETLPCPQPRKQPESYCTVVNFRCLASFFQCILLFIIIEFDLSSSSVPIYVGGGFWLSDHSCYLRRTGKRACEPVDGGRKEWASFDFVGASGMAIIFGLVSGRGQPLERVAFPNEELRQNLVLCILAIVFVFVRQLRFAVRTVSWCRFRFDCSVCCSRCPSKKWSRAHRDAGMRSVLIPC